MTVLTVISVAAITVCALTFTMILPVSAVRGTVATSCVVELLTNFAGTPLMVTLFCVLSALKFVPVIVTGYPIPMIDGANPLIVGSSCITVNKSCDVALLPFTVTDIGADCAPAGITTVSWVVVAAIAVVVILPNFTVFA